MLEVKHLFCIKDFFDVLHLFANQHLLQVDKRSQTKKKIQNLCFNFCILSLSLPLSSLSQTHTHIHKMQAKNSKLRWEYLDYNFFQYIDTHTYTRGRVENAKKCKKAFVRTVFLNLFVFAAYIFGIINWAEHLSINKGMK
jgi:hypothetical protein